MEVGGLELEILDPNSRTSQCLHPSGEFVCEIFASSDDSAAGVMDRETWRKFPDVSVGLDLDFERNTFLFADGLFQELFDSALGDDLSMIDDHDPIASLLGFVQMVGRKQDGGT